MMKRIRKQRTVMRALTAALICAWLPGGVAWGANPPPLGQIAVPEPPNLSQFVKDKNAAIRLGKALFWDMQVGSDGIQACASCHYRAGADPIQVRARNQIHPGPDGFFQVKPGPNAILAADDFPFFQVTPVDAPLGDPAVTILNDQNDVAGSQGVRLTQFVNVIPGSAVEITTPLTDQLFPNLRQVRRRNTPTTINTVFNFDKLWDGRGRNIFNGETPLGPLDVNAGIWVDDNAGATLVKQKVAIPNASLASQAVGSPLSDVEMSARGRTFPDIGRKMLSLTPLGRQGVHPNDSVLGPLSRLIVQPGGTVTGAKGLNTSYVQMIRDAFQDNLWSSAKLNPNGFTQMEANFSLFWGLAIQLYEATLVSDQTPFDRFLAGDLTAMSPAAQSGFGIFQTACANCHSGSELTNASFTAVLFVSNADHNLIEEGAVKVANGISDVGFSNIGVRPTADDVGRGAGVAEGFPFPLSYSGLAVLQALGQLPFEVPQLLPGMAADSPVVTGGAFKTAGLRNVELTAPYFHNGSMFTLDQVVEFYTRGGNFANAEMDQQMTPVGALRNNPAARAEVVAFLMALTDERVRNESAPFDHPELLIPNGDPEVLIRLPARDANGVAAQTLATVTLNPVTTPTNQASQLISGAREAGAAVAVVVNNGAALPADTASDTTWSGTITLAEGDNSVAVTATDLAGGVTTLTASITLDSTPPALGVNAVTTPTEATSQTISGTVEAGVTPAVTVNTAAIVGPVTVTGGTSWSVDITGLTEGDNVITVTATDTLGNIATATATITVITTVIVPDGNLDGGEVTISDALRALRIAVALIQATPEDLLHGDVAPNGKIDVADALLILRKAVGLPSF